MKTVIEVPEAQAVAYQALICELLDSFSDEKRSGHAIVHFKEGVPMAVEPSPRISLK